MTTQILLISKIAYPKLLSKGAWHRPLNRLNDEMSEFDMPVCKCNDSVFFKNSC